MKAALAVQGITPEPSTPQQLLDYSRTDIDRCKKFVVEQNITLD